MTSVGAILAGGESRRYGAPKALAEVGGTRIIDRVVRALGTACADLVVIANEPELFTDLGLPIRPDVHAGLGALGGIHAALDWAREEGRPGVVAVACDMPFLAVPLLRRLADAAFAQPTGGAPRLTADAVLPSSRGRRGLEPLCAAYTVGCLSAIEAQIARDDRRMIGFHEDIRVLRLPLAEVESLCDPEIAFMNVNTPGERDRAEEIARTLRKGAPRAD